MRKQMFKIAGVKNEKEFYKKFPTEKAFMAKHGKTFKAQIGTTIPDLNGLMNIPDYNTGVGIVNDSNLQAKFPGLGNTPLQQGNANMLGSMNSATDALGRGAGAGFMDNMGGVGGLASSGLDIVNGISAIKGQKEAVAESLQGRKVSDISLMAAQTEDVDARRMRTEQGERKYDQRMRAVNGEEFFPINGVGTNILSKNGSTIKAQYGYTPFNANSSARSIGAAASGLAGQFMNNDAGSQIGGGIGKIGGTAIAGPIGGFVGETAGKLIGGTIDRSDEKIKKNNAFTERNMMQMGNIAMAGGIHQYNNAYMQNGGTMMESGGEVTPTWGGGISPISHNPYTKGGETNMINGKTHAKGGVGLHYSNAENGSSGMTKIEAEGSEPIMDTEQGMTIFGKLPINKKTARMIGDPEAKGRKFRTYIADQAKKEDKINKRLSSVEKQELLYEGTKVGTLESKTKDLIKMGNDMKLKSIAEHKERAAVAQESLNIVAEETGIPVEKLAGNENKLDAYLKHKANKDPFKFKSKSRYAENGETLYAETGITTTSDSTTTVPITTFKSKKEALANGFEEKDGQFVKLITPGTEGSAASRKLIEKGVAGTAGTFDTSKIELESTGIYHNDVWANNKDGVQQKYKTKEDYIAAAEAWRVAQKNKLISIEEQKFTEGIKATDDVYENIAAIKGTDPEYAYANVKNDPFNAIPYANMLMPLLRGTDAEALNPNQLYGEMFALSNNQEDPVQGQSYRPELDVPYDISMQDQLNRNTSVFRGAQRMSQGNEGQLAMLQAQQYEADQPVYGEQFRQNQAMKDRVYSGNRATLNDAQMKNIQLNDQQYVRQAQAKSNTKEASQLALNSMSDKYAKNELEQRTLKTYENLYNYRFGNDYRAQNVNNLVDFQGRIASAGQNSSTMPMTPEEIAERKRQAAGGTPGITAKYGSSLSKAFKNF